VNDGEVNVRYEAIAEFEAALGRFAQASLERIRTAETAISRTVDQLKDRRSELRREMSRLQSAISNADEEEDTSWEQRRLEEAEGELSNVRKWQRKIEESVQRYKCEAQRLEELSTGTATEARAYLRGLLNDLSAYFALQKDGGSGSSLGSNAGPAGIAGNGEGADPEAFDPTSFLLPAGYHWIRVTEIDTKGELADVQSNEAFEKVPYDEMRRGFHALRNEVLPAMNDAANPASVDTFASRDAAAGVAYEHGLQRVYEAFFGNDPIYLSRGRDAESFSVTSGRHRIKTAMDAGWTAVPAKASDLSAT
jgi:hypothetical protein